MSQEENNMEEFLPSFQKDQLEKLKREAERIKTWRKEVAENTAMQAFFEQFDEDSVKSFVNSYFTYKNMWVEYGGMYSKMMEEDSIHWVSKASEYLKYIQQKKLFDLQCLWRAEKIELPDVQICIDFEVWEHNILNCPFVDPISPDDLELMQQFLQHNNSDTNMNWFDEWQDYDEIKEAYNSDDAERNFPDWYDFYNGRRGTGVYMLLPNIRGEKEDVYIDLWRASMQKQWDANAKQAANNTTYKKSIHWFDKEMIDWFISTFESKEIQQYYKAFEWSDANREGKEELEYDLELLFKADEYVPIEAHFNWKEAIQMAAHKYRNKKIAEAMPEAYEQYLINVNMGIGFANDSGLYDSVRNLKKSIIERILIGRKLNGEPENLDF